MRLIFYFSLLNVLFIFSNANAQVDITVQFSSNELVEYHSSNKSILYSYDSVFLEIKGKGRYYYPEEIESIKANDLFLVTKNVRRAKVYKKEFVEQVIEGYMSLYKSKNTEGKLCLYLQKEDSMIYYIPEKYFKGYINSLFSDCEKLNIEMEKKSLQRFTYKLYTFYELVSFYNNCMDKDSKSITFKEPKILFNKYVAFGATTSTIKTSLYPFDGQNYSLKLSPHFGVAMGYLYSNRLGFFIGLNYSKIHSTSMFTTIGTRFDENNSIILANVDIDLGISFHLVEVPLSLYIQPVQFKHLKPYIEFGPRLDVLFMDTSKVTADDDYTEGINYKYDIRFDMLTLAKFINLGIETTKFNKKFNLNFGISNSRYGFIPMTSYGFHKQNSNISFTKYLLSLRMFI